MNFFDSYYETAQEIESPEARNEFYGAVIEFYYTGEKPVINTPEARIAFTACRVNIENSRAKAMNGSKGGEAKARNWQEKNKKPSEGQAPPKQEGKQSSSKPVAKTKQEAKQSPSDKDMEKEEDKDATNVASKTPKPPYAEIVDYLNEKAGTSYKASSEQTKKLIDARFKVGFTLDDFKAVIDNRVARWLNDPDMRQYLRPSTLFGNKFEGYLNDKLPRSSGGGSLDKYQD